MKITDSSTIGAPQVVLLTQFSLYVHKGGLKPHAFNFIFITNFVNLFVTTDAVLEYAKKVTLKTL